MEATGRNGDLDSPTAKQILSLNNVEVIYDQVILVLRGLSLAVGEGEIVALLGSIVYNGERIDGRDAAEIVRRGISQVMEGRRVFEHLTAEENLRAGAYARRRNGSFEDDLELVYTYFPPLYERRRQAAGYLSGGEQQMLAIGRALMARPKLLMLDEPSLGLAPRLVAEIFEIIKRLNAELGATVIVVEQNARSALEIASYGFVMENGRIVLDGPAAELAENPDVMEFYLGLTEAGERRSYRAVKHYKRRKRWL
jgi:branched-chain amino acid transport system ATP-binding protein